jgi:Cu(I)/Ag(I) efflux system membrane protein CusA/SilA
LNRLIHFCLHQKLVVLLLLILVVGWGMKVAPFDWNTGPIERDPVPVDAIPDLGDNQQIVFTEFPGRSPQDVEDQITYPLTVSLLGIPGVREVRSFSMFGYSYVYLIFEEDIEFYWSRSRVLEKLNSLPSNLVPEGVTPSLGPDATGLGQVYWYVLEGRDPDGKPIGGWDLDELRSIQDWQVRYALLSAKGVAEVASVGGFVKQYQVEVDPNALRAYDVHLPMVADAVRKANQEIGARNLAINGVEYILRGTGYIESLEDLRDAVVTVRDNVPITVGDVGTVQLGPAMRRGALDLNGADAAGGVVVSRYGANPMETITNLKSKVAALTDALPIRVVFDWDKVDKVSVVAFANQQGIEDAFVEGEPNLEAWLAWTREVDRSEWPDWLNTSKVTIQSFYDRSTLIDETLNTLNEALFQQVLVTIIVVLIMVLHLRSSLLISAMLPLAVLVTFIAMKKFGIDANIVALSGIAIAIGTVVDVGIVLTENILKHLDEALPDKSRALVIYEAVTEVASAVATSVATTVVSFLPVFSMTGEAGRLFRPLAFTKTFALIASILVALTIIPPLAHLLFKHEWKFAPKRRASLFINVAFALAVVWVLARDWMPLGLDRTVLSNILFVVLIIGGLLTLFRIFERFYGSLLAWCLRNKALFLSVPLAFLFLALLVWQGAPKVLGFLPGPIKESRIGEDLQEKFPGLGREFRPSLDEGSFLFMPTISPHASIEEAIDSLRTLDAAIATVPEVHQVVGKIGRVESPLDPAPISMIETVINYLPEYRSDSKGRPLRFRTDKAGDFIYKDGDLVPDKRGKPFRLWRPHIKSPEDIWAEIDRVAKLPGATGAPKLQPIETRLVMLRTGMRAPMGIKIKGPSLEVIEKFGLDLERLLRSGEVKGLNASTVNADRIVGKPYLEIVPDRQAAKRYGLNIADIHETVQLAVGGKVVSMTVEGRERYGVQVRYAREMRDSIQSLEEILVTSKEGAVVPLSQLAEIRYIRGPQVIKAEDTFLTGYLTFGSEQGSAEIDVVEAAQAFLDEKEASGDLVRPPGVRYEFAGNYESALEFNRTLAVMLPLCLISIFILLYLQNKSATTTLIIFSGVMVAWSGGFLMLWLYGRPGFLDFSVFGINLRELFQINPVNLSTAVWVGFLALFGIATDDGVVIATYLRQKFDETDPKSIEEIRKTTMEAGLRRVRPCLMTTGTTLLALLPVLTSTGRGSDIMVPMAIPVFGGMAIELMTMFVVPVLFSLGKERALKKHQTHQLVN